MFKFSYIKCLIDIDVDYLPMDFLHFVLKYQKVTNESLK